MLERTLQVQNAHGIHARPAAEIVKVAGRFTSNITIARDGLEVNAKSIMGVMLLAAGQGTPVTVRIEGEDEAVAMREVVSLFERRFDEEG